MEKKNFLFVTDGEDVDFLFLKIKEEKHSIRIFSSSRSPQRSLQGMIKAKEWVDHWKDHIDWADIIVFDGEKWGKHADQLRARGHIVVGGSRYTDQLERNREFGQQELQKSGVPILQEKEFSRLPEVIRFIRENPGRYVLKPYDTHDMDTTMVGSFHDGSDLVALLSQHKKQFTFKKYILQQYADGVELAIGAFFNGKDFLSPINLNCEHKRLFPGDQGPLTWEMGTIVHYTDRKNALFQRLLLPLTYKLRASGYRGYIDVNCIVNKEGIHPLEFTCRFGFPISTILWEGNTRNAADVLWAIGSGNRTQWSPVKGNSVGVVVVMPPFPYDDEEEEKKYSGTPVLITRPTRGLYWCDVERKRGQLVTNDFCPLIVVAHGTTMDSARKKVYQRLKNVSIENMYYRDDIGEKWERQSRLLKRWGYL